MGKYATYRLRGGGGPAPSGLPAPPPGVIEDYENELFSTSSCVDNPAGFVELWYSIDGMFGWTLELTRDWEPNVIWGVSADFDEGTYKSRDIGNGIDYEGYGAWSNNVVLTHP
jgi:hypothetical protein